MQLVAIFAPCCFPPFGVNVYGAQSSWKGGFPPALHMLWQGSNMHAATSILDVQTFEIRFKQEIQTILVLQLPWSTHLDTPGGPMSLARYR